MAMAMMKSSGSISKLLARTPPRTLAFTRRFPTPPPPFTPPPPPAGAHFGPSPRAEDQRRISSLLLFLERKDRDMRAMKMEMEAVQTRLKQLQAERELSAPDPAVAQRRRWVSVAVAVLGLLVFLDYFFHSWWVHLEQGNARGLGYAIFGFVAAVSLFVAASGWFRTLFGINATPAALWITLPSLIVLILQQVRLTYETFRRLASHIVFGNGPGRRN